MYLIPKVSFNELVNCVSAKVATATQYPFVQKILRGYVGANTKLAGLAQSNLVAKHGAALLVGGVVLVAVVVAKLWNKHKANQTKDIELTARETALANREAAVQSSETALAARETAVASREVEVTAGEAAASARAAALAEGETALESREQASSDIELGLQAREAVLTKAEMDRGEEFGSRMRELDADRAQFEAGKSEADRRLQGLIERVTVLEPIIAAKMAEISRLERKLRTHKSYLEQEEEKSFALLAHNQKLKLDNKTLIEQVTDAERRAYKFLVINSSLVIELTKLGFSFASDTTLFQSPARFESEDKWSSPVLGRAGAGGGGSCKTPPRRSGVGELQSRLSPQLQKAKEDFDALLERE